MMQVYLGYDDSEVAAYDVARKSLFCHSPGITINPLEQRALRSKGLYSRPEDFRGQPYDFISQTACSTQFSASRFLTPILCQSGFALFADCDVIFYRDVLELLSIVDHSKAVSVVKHDTNHGNGAKMGGLKQTNYPRKNWSSVMLFNCDHPANRRLSLHDVNNRSAKDLHRFYWLHDDEIGELPAEWNWLVGVQDEPDDVAIAHFTLGGPWLANQEPGQHDQLWIDSADFFGVDYG